MFSFNQTKPPDSRCSMDNVGKCLEIVWKASQKRTKKIKSPIWLDLGLFAQTADLKAPNIFLHLYFYLSYEGWYRNLNVKIERIKKIEYFWLRFFCSGFWCHNKSIKQRCSRYLHANLCWNILPNITILLSISFWNVSIWYLAEYLKVKRAFTSILRPVP